MRYSPKYLSVLNGFIFMNKKFNIFRLISSNHDWIYFGGLCLLAFSLSVSPFALSVSQFTIAGNWLVEQKFKQKFSLLKSQPALLLFLSVFLIHVIGMFYSTNWGYGLHDLKIKLPLLGIPIVIATSEKLSPQKIKIILLFYILGVFAGTLISYGAYLGFFGFEYVDVREISFIISHIRFALYIVLAVAILLFSFSQLENIKLKVAAVTLILWLHFFLIVLQAYTGVILIIAVDVVFVIHYLTTKTQRTLGFIISIVFLLSVGSFIFYNINEIVKILAVKDEMPANRKAQTKYGNSYTFYDPEPITENGYHIYWYVSREELDTAWTKRSDLPLFYKQGNKQDVFYTLIRYLSSKGLKKDSEGLQQLSDNDIKNIENGIANYLYVEFNPVKKRTLQILWEINNYFKGGNPTNHSVSQRIEYAKAGYTIFKNNFWFGVGTGDVLDAFADYYAKSNTRLSKEKQFRTHNQYLTFYLTFGIFIGTYILFAFFYPIFLKRKEIGLIVAIFLLIVFLSMLSEDTLETQAGVTFFSYFYSLFLFGRKKKNKINYLNERVL